MGSVATTVSGARGGSGFVRLPVEERVVECTVDGDRVRPSWLAEAGERVVRCRDCEHLMLGWCDLLEFKAPDMEEHGFCAWGVAKECDER